MGLPIPPFAPDLFGPDAMTKPGAYLVTGTMANGSVSRILLWVNDTVIVKKMLDNQSLYYVADAVSGAPIENAKLEFFGWRTEQIAPNKNDFRVLRKRLLGIVERSLYVIRYLRKNIFLCIKTSKIKTPINPLISTYRM